MAQDPGSTPRKSGLTNTKLRLSAANPTSKGKWATLSFNVWNNNPRIQVNTNDPALSGQDNNYGRIEAALDYPCMFATIELLKRAINSKDPIKFKIEAFGTQRGGDPKTPTLLSDVWVGRDDQGGIYLSVITKKEGWPVIKFLFGPSDNRFHKFYHSGNGGAEFTKEERSILYAKAYVTILEQAMGSELVNHFVPPPAFNGGGNRQGGGGYNKGGYNKGNGNGGGYQKNNYQQSNTSTSSASSDDGDGGDFSGDEEDIPF